ncbi:EamA family transporter [Thalassotalea nanhaiensis]|uniref:EamA family transporter n=1 Tax=Thalassotalea nanhaiensis TaxID=3065648 RepID=A0ABY9THW1_9GAMM|nr:EamA family transporter [Colwelliaceae bacterium SQ345]
MVKRELNSTHTSFLSLHGAVILLALCALFAKWLTLPAIYIVVGRSLFAALALFIFCSFTAKRLNISKQLLLKLAVSGLLLAIHWWSFFHTIQISSVTLGLLTFACFPLFVGAISVILKWQEFKITTFLQALLCIIGIYLVVSTRPIDTINLSALGYGLFSALSFAVLTLFNKIVVKKNTAITVAFWQNLFAGIWLCPAFFIYQMLPSNDELMLIALLGIVFTAFAHSLLLHSLQLFSAFTVSLTLTLEPLYGIAAAWFFLDERLTMVMLIGATLIVVVNYWAGKEQVKTLTNKEPT